MKAAGMVNAEEKERAGAGATVGNHTIEAGAGSQRCGLGLRTGPVAPSTADPVHMQTGSRPCGPREPPMMQFGPGVLDGVQILSTSI